MKINYMMINSYVSRVNEIDCEPVRVGLYGQLIFNLESHQCSRCGSTEWFYCHDPKVPFLACHSDGCMSLDAIASKNADNSINISYNKLRSMVNE